jgi:VanZ family protein
VGLTSTLLYMLLLGVGGLITPGIGVAGSLLASVPQPVSEYAHVPAYGLLTWLVTKSLWERDWPKRTALCIAAAGAMVIGIWMEILQGLVPGRVVDIGDVAFNAIGIGLATLLIEAAAPQRRSCKAARERPSGMSPNRCS